MSVIRTPNFYATTLGLIRSLGGYIRPKANVYNAYRIKYSYQTTLIDSGRLLLPEPDEPRISPPYFSVHLGARRSVERPSRVRKEVKRGMKRKTSKDIKPYDYAEENFTPAFFIGAIIIVMIGAVVIGLALMLALWVITGIMSIW